MTIINATVYKIDGTCQRIELKPRNRLKTLQGLVGGYIQVIELIPLKNEIKRDFSIVNDLVIDEEGGLKDLPVNPWSEKVCFGTKWQRTPFRGDIILIEGKLP